MAQTTIDFSIDWAAFSAAAGADLANFAIVSGSNTPAQHTWGMLANSYVAATYDFHRGAALSTWVRASNTAGALTNVTAGTDGHVLRRSGTTLGYGTLRAGAFATGPGIVTFAMMDDGSARSVPGRAANSSGVRADIAGTGTAAIPQVLSDNGTTVAFRSVSSLVDTAKVIYEVDYSSLANNTFADGVEVIDGINWTVANSVELATFDISNGNGLRAINAISNGGAATMLSSSQTAPYLYTELQNIPGFSPEYDHIFEIYCSTIVQEQDTDGVLIGLWGVAADPSSSSVARMRAGGIVNGAAASVRVLQSVSQATTANSSEERLTANVLSVRINGTGTGHIMSGVWSGTWPSLDCGLNLVTTAPLVDPFNHGSVRLFIAFPVANDATPTTAHTVQRMRIRRV